MTLKIQKIESNGVVYADPLRPLQTVRFRSTVSPKVLSGVQTKNYLTEIIVNDDNPVTVAGVAGSDPVSVRIRVSGSAESMPRIKKILAGLGVQLDDWADESVFIGFNPVTAPVIAD